jgi:hypothetical protein
MTDMNDVLNGIQQGQTVMAILNRHANTLQGMAALASELEQAGITLEGGEVKVASKGRGRPKGSKNRNTNTAAVKEAGPPQGKVFSSGARGRKQCPNCHKFTASRSAGCPNCFYNFEDQEVKAYDGVTAPFYKKGNNKAAAKPAKAKVAKAKPASDNDGAIERATMKHLRKASKENGISAKDLLTAVCQDTGLPPTEVNTVLRNVLKTSAEKNQKNNWTVKAA